MQLQKQDAGNTSGNCGDDKQRHSSAQRREGVKRDSFDTTEIYFPRYKTV